MTETSPIPDRPIRDAASVLVIDRTPPGGPAVLMGMRGAGAAFMPSKYVFPGGAVDPTDDLPAHVLPDMACNDRLNALARPGCKDSAVPLAAAALRELAEETGLLIGRQGVAPAGFPEYSAAGLVPDATQLIFVFRAITPPGRPRRFDARFFMVDAAHVSGDRSDFSAAADELSHLHWVPLTEARRLDLPFITEVVLAEVQALVTAAGDGPLFAPPVVPFFDNASATPGFYHIP